MSFLNIFISAFFAAGLILSVFLFKKTRFSDIPLFLISGAALAFVFDFVLLALYKKKSKASRMVKIISLSVVNFLIFFSLSVYSFSLSMIFQPHFDEASYEKLNKIPLAREMLIETELGKISGWFYNNAGERAPVFLSFYGNYENASTRLCDILASGDLKYFSGCNIAVFDYPGYGLSSGRSNEKSLKNFGLAVFDELAKKNKNIVVHGYSIGTGVAVYVASQRDVAGMILYAPFADGYDLYNNFISIFHSGLMKRLVSFKMESVNFAKTVKTEPLIIASEDDEIINYASSVRLSKEFENCRFVTLKNVLHNNFWSDETVKKETLEYLKEVKNRES